MDGDVDEDDNSEAEPPTLSSVDLKIEMRWVQRIAVLTILKRERASMLLAGVKCKL